MKITREENMMYELMKAIYDSGIPMNFKGSMVLKACLLDAGYTEDTRHTRDIDANWIGNDPPSSEQMVESLQSVVKKSGFDLDVRLYRRYGEGRSAGFELINKNTGEPLFTMDVDVNRPVLPTKIYEVDGLRFRGAALSQMVADKVSSVSTDKVFRRIKDVVDLYYISKVFDFDKDEIVQTLKNSVRALGDFNGFLYRVDELSHAYEKFRFSGGVNKPAFEEVYSGAKTYIKDLLELNKVNVFGLVRDVFVMEAKTVPKEQVDKSFNNFMTEFQKRQDTLKRDSALVAKDPLNLQRVSNQTPDLCFCAVHSNGMALEFVKEQTPQICAEAIHNNPKAIQFVRNQTEDLCMSAVKSNGLVLQHIKNPSLDVCKEAVRNTVYASKFLPEQFKGQFTDALAKLNIIMQKTQSVSKRRDSGR